MKNRQTEVLFRDAYEIAFGVRPVFNLDHLSNSELEARTELIERAATGSTGAYYFGENHEISS